MSKTYFNNYGKNKNIRSFSCILTFASLFLVSNLSASCIVSGDIIECDESVSASVYESFAQNSSYNINTAANNAYGVYNNNNGSWVFNSLNITTSGANAYALFAQNGSIAAGDYININTAGSNSAAIYTTQNSTITVGSYVNIYTNGTNSYGISARGLNAANKAVVNTGDNVNILTEGSQVHSTGRSNADGLNVNFGDVNIGDNLSILTKGIGSFGMRIDNVSNVKIGDRATIMTVGNTGCGSCGVGGSGWFSYGVEVRRGSNVTIGDNLTVSTIGNGTLAIQVLSGDSMPNGYTYLNIGNNLKVSTAGPELSVGLWAQGASIVNIGDNAFITTTGGINKGPTNAVQADMRASSGGVYYYPKITMGNNATIITTGGYSHAIYALQGYVTLGNDAKIITTGGSSVGIYSWGSSSNLANSVGGASVVVGDNAIVSTGGDGGLSAPAYGASSGSNAVYARQGGNVTFGNSASLSVNGNSATVVHISNYSPTALTVFDTNVNFQGTSTLNANGTNTKILELTYANASLDFRGSTTFNTFGDNINVFAVSNAGNDKYNSNVRFYDTLNVNSHGDNSKAVYLDNGYSYDFNELNINIYGKNSHALYIAGGSNLSLDNKTVLKAFDNSSYALYSDAGMITNTDSLDIYGQIFSSNNGVISLTFDNTSIFTGSTDINNGELDLSFDNSKWNILQNSTLSSLRLLNNDLIYMNASSSFLTLRTDNLFGNGIFNMKLDANRSLNDKIVIGN
ncbi:MAG: hypothetical protein LBB59_01105, partial [Campylobacteraceae bacterium]|nr:hypothetical protein [Campylobacteraceae bacterium]